MDRVPRVAVRVNKDDMAPITPTQVLTQGAHRRAVVSHARRSGGSVPSLWKAALQHQYSVFHGAAELRL